MLIIGEGCGRATVFYFLVLVVGETIAQFNTFKPGKWLIPAAMKLNSVLPHISIRARFFTMLFVVFFIFMVVSRNAILLLKAPVGNTDKALIKDMADAEIGPLRVNK